MRWRNRNPIEIKKRQVEGREAYIQDKLDRMRYDLRWMKRQEWNIQKAIKLFTILHQLEDLRDDVTWYNREKGQLRAMMRKRKKRK